MTTTTASLTPVLIERHPALDESRTRVTLPVRTVTLLEDRAQVRREGTVALAAGHNRLALWGLSPVVQDVSLRVELAGGKVLDSRVRRAWRVGWKEKPEQAAALEKKIEALGLGHQDEAEEQTRARERAAVVLDMMQKAMQEVPEDAAWSLGHPQTWRETFESLSGKARALLGEARDHADKMLELQEQIRHLLLQRQIFDRPDLAFECVAEIDVDASVASPAAGLALEYTVPNALWRPFHTAELRDGKLRFSSQAAVWQNTGEDWVDAALVFSTARSSLGHEPPKLADDKLAAKKKDQKVVVEAREQAISQAGLGRGGGGGAVGGGPATPMGLTLPGVDDGGDIQNLRATTRVTVPSDGRPSFIPVFDLESDAEASLVVMAELEDKAFFKSVQTHTGKHPILAGPVELVKSSGFVGTTRTLFVAPGERFALGFGPDHDVRVQRTVETDDEVDSVDKWRRRTVSVSIFLSNLSGEEKHLEIQERIPVSEIEHVKITLVADKTSAAPALSEHGIVSWKMPLPPLGRLRLQLVYVVATAPGVQGL